MEQETQQLAMAGAAPKSAPQGQQQEDKNPALAALEQMLSTTAEQRHREFSKARFAEEREWYEAALFYQRRQWLSWNSSTKRWQLIKKDPSRPKPMPVTNHFARTVNSNANQLGARPPQMVATPHDDSDEKRRAADMGEKAIKTIDRESGMNLLNPLLAKHVVLWGVGVTKDFYDLSKSTGSTQIPTVDQMQSELFVSCPDCGGSYDAGPAPEGVDPSTVQMPCPQCGSQSTMPFVKESPAAVSVNSFAKGRLCTEVRPIFEVYLPRDAQDPNLAKEVIHKYRKPLGECKRIWGDAANDLKADDKVDIHEIYLEALRSLVNYNYMHDQQGEVVSILEYWADYDALPQKLCEYVEQMAERGELEQDDIQEAMDNGIYVITAGGKVLDWGANQLGGGKKPFTFFCWEKDPASVYNKGLASDLIPVQKRLNRLDSLIELAVQTNAVGKWLWPRTQTSPKPSGSPNEVVEYDTIGDGKVKPEFVLPHPFSPMVWQLRATIMQDFDMLGMTNAIQAGQTPGGGKMPFRGLAYLGAKASEQLNTARALWENAHTLRYEKTLILAQKNWTEPRMASVAGFNNKSSMTALMGSDLGSGFTLDFVPDSSRPIHLDEKFMMFQMLLEGGMVDPADPATRDFVMDLSNLDGLNLADHMQYAKAARDLEKLKQGQPPRPNPYLKWDIHLKFFANYIQSEEFEALDPQLQMGIEAYATLLNQQMSMVNNPMAGMMPQPGGAGAPSSPAGRLAGAIAGKGQGGNNPLSGIPGESVTGDSAESAAAKQGSALGGRLP